MRICKASDVTFDYVLYFCSYQLYYGHRAKAEEWFIGGLGYPKPADTSVVDYILDLVNIDFAKEADEGKATMLSIKDVQDACASFKDQGAQGDKKIPFFFLSCPLYQSSSLLKKNVRRPPFCFPFPFYSGPLIPISFSCFSSEYQLSSIFNKSTLFEEQDWRRKGIQEVVNVWLWKYKLVLARNFKNYYSSPTNALGRLFMTVSSALLMGLIYYGVGSHAEEDMFKAYVSLYPKWLSLHQISLAYCTYPIFSFLLLVD